VRLVVLVQRHVLLDRRELAIVLVPWFLFGAVPGLGVFWEAFLSTVVPVFQLGYLVGVVMRC